jgi:hypothetical protein
MTSAEPGLATELLYVVYDAQTGRVVHTHSRFSVERDRDVEVDEAEVLAITREDDLALEKTTDRDTKNLAVLTVREPAATAVLRAGALVDVAQKRLVAKPSLQLTAEKTRLEGNGSDSTSIQIAVVDPNGRPVARYTGSVKVATSRGKLSARGGIVDVRRGRGEITLTSVAETVDKVTVTATATDGRAQRADLDLEFL